MKQPNIIFVSYMQDPYACGSSTQIMVKNILWGLKEVSNKVTFVAITNQGCNNENIREYYSKDVNKVITAESYLNLSSKNKYAQLFQNAKGLIKTGVYQDAVAELNLAEADILISHTPSFESFSFCREVLKRKKNLRYIQYWSDPYTLSLTVPEKVGPKRLPFRMLESYLLSRCDEVVYGTKSLMDGEKVVFPKFAHKMRYVDAGYGTEDIDNPERVGKTEVFGYSGNFYQKIRDIKPLLWAFENLDYAKLLVCGSGDVEIPERENIRYLSRVSQQEIPEIEKQMDVLVCLLNKDCIQIPGKIFYNTNSNKPILIILDGPYKDEMREYLEDFDRFEFCENNEESIRAAVAKIQKSGGKVNLSQIHRLSPEAIAKDLIGVGIQ